MAQKVTVVLSDDLDGSSADETVQFGLDGSSYEIDLSNDHARSLREAVGEYVESARRVGGGTLRVSTAAKSPALVRTSAAENGAIRAWAKKNGYEVSERGRISENVRRAYDAAL